MMVDWVHPSWRDVVIDALAADPEERRRFLRCCGVDGAAVALSFGGGSAGDRVRPLLVTDADWDALGDGLHHLCADLAQDDATRLLEILAAAGADAEARALRELVLTRLQWGGKALGVDAIAAWAAVADGLDPRPEPPAVAMTWLELEPSCPPQTPEEVERIADWLRLAELLARHDPELLAGLGFPDRYGSILVDFANQVPVDEPVLERDLRIESLDRIAALHPAMYDRVVAESAALRIEAEADVEPGPEPVGFPIDRVLSDL